MMTDILVFTENTDSQQVKWWVYTSSSIKTSKGVSRPFLSLFFLSLLACHGGRGLKIGKKGTKSDRNISDDFKAKLVSKWNKY